MKKRLFGTNPALGEVQLYILKNETAELTLSDYGARIVGFTVYGRDIVGGFDSLEAYIADDSHQGGTIGRVANRIGGARFTMDGVEYTLPDNDGGSCLHGGCGFDRRMWNLAESTDDSISFTYRSPDGEEGFPSALDVKVTYTLLRYGIRIDYEAHPHGRTPIALTNHAYFNLNGFGGDVLDHEVKIYADRYTEVGDDLIPNGNRPSVEGTVLDFRQRHRIGERLAEGFGGYDHNYILSGELGTRYGDSELWLAASVYGKELKMKVYTDQPGVQFYIGNFLGDGPDFKGGIKQIRRGAFCLETQTEPNCIKNGIGFYGKGEVYRHTSVYKIGLVRYDSGLAGEK